MHRNLCQPTIRKKTPFFPPFLTRRCGNLARQLSYFIYPLISVHFASFCLNLLPHLPVLWDKTQTRSHFFPPRRAQRCQKHPTSLPSPVLKKEAKAKEGIVHGTSLTARSPGGRASRTGEAAEQSNKSHYVHVQHCCSPAPLYTHHVLGMTWFPQGHGLLGPYIPFQGGKTKPCNPVCPKGCGILALCILAGWRHKTRDV